MFGMGPVIVGPGLLWVGGAWYAGWRMERAAVGGLGVAATWLGVALTSVGVVLYVMGASQLHRGAVSSRLVTTGLFAWCRHPLYAVWMFLLLPGLACLVGSWAALAAPGVSALFFQCFIRSEETELESRFGIAYRDYAARVGRLWPRGGEGQTEDRGR